MSQDVSHHTYVYNKRAFVEICDVQFVLKELITQEEENFKMSSIILDVAAFKNVLGSTTDFLMGHEYSFFSLCTHTEASREWMRYIKTAVLTIIKYLMNLNLILCLGTRKWEKTERTFFKKVFPQIFHSSPIDAHSLTGFIIILSLFLLPWKIIDGGIESEFLFAFCAEKFFFLLGTKYTQGGGMGRKKYDDIGQKQTSRNK